MKNEKLLTEEEINLISLAQQYSDEDKARGLLEAWRWPNGPVCPRCKCDKAYAIISKPESKTQVRKGLYKCKECRNPFTVTVGTILENSHISISKWLMAFFMMSSSKKGISAHQLHRMLKMTYRSAWFMCHRIRHAMNEGPIAEMLKGTVEIDETYVGGKPRPFDGKPTKKGRGTLHKTPVVALIQRNGDVRTKVVSNVSQKNLRQFVGENIEKGTVVNTDSFAMYHSLLWPIYRMGKGRHDVVNHKAKEYARHNLDGSVARNSDVEVYTSMITVSECTHIEPGKPQPAKKVQEFFDQLLMSGKSGVLLVQLTARINDISKDLRWKDKLSLRGMDAIHLATAIDKCCCEMITTDGKLKNCPAHHRGIKIIQASDTKELPSKYDNWELEDYAKSKGKT